MVAAGTALGRALKIVGLGPDGFSNAISSVKTLGLAYAQAREIQSDIEVDNAVEIADDENIDPARARNMIDIRKWRASKHHSRLFGDRVELNVQQSIDIRGALDDARGRLSSLPISDPVPILDAIVLDSIGLSQGNASDDVSDAPESAVDGPDIFS